MNCPNCGVAVNDSNDFCPRCGQNLNASAIQASSTGQDAGMRLLLPVGRSTYAIAAGYVGIFALFCAVPGPIAIILGILAIKDIRKHPEKHGMGRAVFALFTGAIGTLVIVFVVVLLILDVMRKH